MRTEHRLTLQGQLLSLQVTPLSKNALVNCPKSPTVLAGTLIDLLVILIRSCSSPTQLRTVIYTLNFVYVTLSGNQARVIAFLRELARLAGRLMTVMFTYEIITEVKKHEQTQAKLFFLRGSCYR